MLRRARGLAVLSFALWTLISISGALAQSGACTPVTYERNNYIVCEIDLRVNAIRLFWKRPDNTAYSYLRALPQSLEPGGGKLIFASNAGMFDPAYKPVGLYIEHGRQLVHANTRSGYGNFHMKPNGVFFVAGDVAGVMETGAYLKQRLHPDFATQSGPMLVVNGKVHPRFDRNSSSLKARNGIGSKDAHTVVFAMSEGEVSFDAFARLFSDRLNCSNALFLDGGSAPSLLSPSLNRGGNLLALGPMMGVYEKANTSDQRNARDPTNRR